VTAAYRRPAAFALDVAPQPRLQSLVALLVVLSATAGLAAWVVHWAPAIWLALLLPIVSWQAWRLAAVAPRRLQFDGDAWWLGTPGRAPQPCRRLEVVFDFETWLLLRVDVGRWRYLPIARHQAGADWGRLRATLYAARPAPEADGPA